MSFHNEHTPGEMIERVDGDVTACSSFFSQFMVRLLGGGLLILGALAFLSREDWRVGLALTIFAAGSLALLLRLRDVAAEESEAERQSIAQMYRFVEERLAGHRLDSLQVAGLTYRHPESQPGIQEISLSLRRGQTVVVTGRIGSGKTTLLRAFWGLLPCEAGEIWWNGVPVEEPSGFFEPPRAAYTAQVPRLFSESLSENVLAGVSADQERLGAALRRVVMHRTWANSNWA